MSDIRHPIIAAACCCVVMALSGCADDSKAGSDTQRTSASATTDQPLSQVPPPTLSLPSAPPTKPSDPMPTKLIVGRVLETSSGPCYLVETDDGLTYAVRASASGQLDSGTTVRVKLSMRVSTADCTGGVPVEASTIEAVG